ncbi:MAG: L-histidine N(alpha)-methyltransferase, partial [Nitrospirales bacterium]
LPDLAPGLHRLGKYFCPHRDLRVTVGGEDFTFRDGERVDMNHSGKYERTAFLNVVTGGGFDVAEEFESEDHRFLMVVARPRPVAGRG